MLVIGLTGGIGSGKSTVADLFSQLGVPVIDTDIISRQLVEPGKPALEEIKVHFENILTPGGELDRSKLRQIIFTEPEKRQQLENILHPRIQEEVRSQLAQQRSAYAIVVIPLLAEKGQWSFIDRVLVVDCNKNLQIQRTMDRDVQNEVQVESVIKSQASRQQRLAIADDVITNESDFTHLQFEVDKLDKKYRQLAGN